MTAEQPAADASAESTVSERMEAISSALEEELRQARRRGVILGVLARHVVTVDERDLLDALVNASPEHEGTCALSLLAAIPQAGDPAVDLADGDREVIARDIVQELRALEQPLVPGDVIDAEDVGDGTDAGSVAAQIGSAIGQLGGPASLRVIAVVGTMEERNLHFADAGSSRRDDQVECLKALVEAERNAALSKAVEFLTVIEHELDQPTVEAIAAAIVTAMRAVDGDQTALETLAADNVEAESGAAPAAVESPALPVHRAVCMTAGCKAGVMYRPTSSGNGFQILERYGMDVDTQVGIGAQGRPTCPKGHGEMTLADEQLPAAEAIAQASARVEREKKPQPRLPYPAPPFNYEGAFHAIVEKQIDVAALQKKWEDLKDRAKEAKDKYDEGAEQLVEMIADFKEREDERLFEIERRESQAAAGHPEGTTLVRCIWEQQNPNDPCPFCPTSLSVAERHAIVKVLGTEILARDANGHAEQVIAYRQKLDVLMTVEALDGVVFRVATETIAEWPTEAREAVRAWAMRQATAGHGVTIGVGERPVVLGTPHVASLPGEKVQTCKTCGGVLAQYDDVTEALPADALVGMDCAGPEKEGFRYPDTSKKPRRPRATAPAKDRGSEIGDRKTEHAARERKHGITKPAAPKGEKRGPAKKSAKARGKGGR